MIFYVSLKHNREIKRFGEGFTNLPIKGGAAFPKLSSL